MPSRKKLVIHKKSKVNHHSKSLSRKRSGSHKIKRGCSNINIPYKNFGMSKLANQTIIDMMKENIGKELLSKKPSGIGLWLSFWSKLYKQIPEYQNMSQKKMERIGDKIENYCNEMILFNR